MMRIAIGAAAFVVAATGLVLSSAPHAPSRPASRPPGRPLAPASPANLAAVAILVGPGPAERAALRRQAVSAAQQEAKALARHPDIARREPGALILSQEGVDTARFDDVGACPASAGCARWSFGGVIQLDGHPVTWLRLSRGDGASRTVLVDPSGGLVGGAGEVTVAPDGRTAVLAFAGDDAAPGSVTVIRSVGGRLRRIGFVQSDCQALLWSGGGRLAMTCEDKGPTGARLMTAELRREADGGWVLARTGAMDPRTLEPIALGQAPPPLRLAIPAEAARSGGQIGSDGDGYRPLGRGAPPIARD